MDEWRLPAVCASTCGDFAGLFIIVCCDCAPVLTYCLFVDVEHRCTVQSLPDRNADNDDAVSSRSDDVDGVYVLRRRRLCSIVRGVVDAFADSLASWADGEVAPSTPSSSSSSSGRGVGVGASGGAGAAASGMSVPVETCVASDALVPLPSRSAVTLATLFHYWRLAVVRVLALTGMRTAPR